MKLQIFNLDRHNCIPHVALDTTHDRGIVVDHDSPEYNVFSREMQPKTVFRGSIPECNKYVEEMMK